MMNAVVGVMMMKMMYRVLHHRSTDFHGHDYVVVVVVDIVRTSSDIACRLSLTMS